MKGYFRLYHFVPEIYGVSNILNKRLKISLFKDMNDPFEMLTYVGKNSASRKVFKEIKTRLGSEVGTICYSKSFKSPVQWAHYADRHRGMCLGFDVKHEYANKVAYIDGRLPFENVDLKDGVSQRLINDLMLTKHSSWSYEREYRGWARLVESDENGLYFSRCSENLILREVILGAASSMSKASAEALLENFESSVDLFKVRPAFRTFEMVRDRSKASWDSVVG